MLSLDEASGLAVARFHASSPERVALGDSLGRFLAGALDARWDEPACDNGAMDGWAVRSADAMNATRDAPARLRIVGESRAGLPAARSLGESEAIRIFTGAVLPEGATAVVMQEDVERRGDEVALFAAPPVGLHVRRRGEVLRAGQTFLDARTQMGPGAIGVAASQGHAFALVHRRPRVAILSTGDELCELGDPSMPPGCLVDSSSHALAAAVREAGGEPLLFPLARDTIEELTVAIASCIHAAEVVVTTGGVSVGDYDLLPQAFAASGVEEVFWKVRVKPGKPVRFGVAGDVPVVGLPGNPVSTLVMFEAFVRPGLRTMIGDPRPFRRKLHVRLSRPRRAPATRTELSRARVEEGTAHLFSDQGSAATTSMIDLDALVIFPEGAGTIETAEALDLRSTVGSARSPWEA